MKICTCTRPKLVLIFRNEVMLKLKRTHLNISRYIAQISLFYKLAVMGVECLYFSRNSAKLYVDACKILPRFAINF